MPIGLGAALLLGGLSAGGSIGSAALGRRRTTSTTTPQLTPQQTQLSQQLSGVLGRNLANPTVRTGAIRRNHLLAKDNINRATDSAVDNAQERLASRGFGRSGLFEREVSGIEGARLQGLSSLEAAVMGQLESAETNAEQQSIENVLRFLQPAGSTTTQQGGGGAIGDGLGAGMETLVTLLTLSKLGGFGGGSGT
jgi:hypothetical protein